MDAPVGQLKPAVTAHDGLPEQPFYELPVALRTALLNYLGDRPHREVDPAVMALRNLKLRQPEAKPAAKPKKAAKA
mgnify:CR=1 FL=1